MKRAVLTFAIAAAALVTAPAFAQMAFAPQIKPLDGEEEALAKSGAIILGVVGAGALIVGIAVLGGEDDDPVSN